MINQHDTAFPIYTAEHIRENGLTKREYFAAMAMQRYQVVNYSFSAEQLAKAAVMTADALIAELNK